jgi:hypothetical protein
MPIPLPTVSAAMTTAGAFKQLREKAADLGLRQNRSARKIEETNADTLRAIGLGADAHDTTHPSNTSAHSHSHAPVAASLHSQENDSDECSTVHGDNTFDDSQAADAVFVHIHTIKLKALRSAAILGHANPYVSLALGRQRVKSAVVWGRRDGWEWVHPDTLTLRLRVSLSRLQQLRLQVRVFDKERIRRKRSLGLVNVSLAGLEVGGVVASWFALGPDNSSGDREERADGGGEIYVGIRIEDGSSSGIASPAPTAMPPPRPLLRSWSSNFRMKT